MMLRATALFEEPDQVDRVKQAFRDAGFRCVRIDRDSTELNTEVEVSAEELIELGFASAEAARFAGVISGGGVLLEITGDEERGDELRAIMESFDLREIPSSEPPRRLRFQPSSQIDLPEGESIDEGGYHRTERSRREFQRADSERMIGEHDSGGATGLSRRAYREPIQYEVPPEASSWPQPTARFNAAVRRHYEEVFSQSSIPFETFSQAYQYGLALAQDETIGGRSWQEIEEDARRGWDAQVQERWPALREAVRFGWEFAGDRAGRRR